MWNYFGCYCHWNPTSYIDSWNMVYCYFHHKSAKHQICFFVFSASWPFQTDLFQAVFDILEKLQSLSTHERLTVVSLLLIWALCTLDELHFALSFWCFNVLFVYDLKFQEDTTLHYLKFESYVKCFDLNFILC